VAILRMKAERDPLLLDDIFDTEQWATIMAANQPSDVGMANENATEGAEPKIDQARELNATWAGGGRLDVAHPVQDRARALSPHDRERLDRFRDACWLMSDELSVQAITDPLWNVNYGADDIDGHYRP
jgi:hypothetical protein